MWHRRIKCNMLNHVVPVRFEDGKWVTANKSPRQNVCKKSQTIKPRLAIAKVYDHTPSKSSKVAPAEFRSKTSDVPTKTFRCDFVNLSRDKRTLANCFRYHKNRLMARTLIAIWIRCGGDTKKVKEHPYYASLHSQGLVSLGSFADAQRVYINSLINEDFANLFEG